MMNDIMDFTVTKDLTDIVANFATVVVAVVAAYFALRYRFPFHPRMRVRVVPRWIDDTHVVLQLRVANRSRIRIGIPDGDPIPIRLQVIECKVLDQLSEWVPFGDADIRTEEWLAERVKNERLSSRETPEPVKGLRPPFRVMHTTTKFDPGEEVLVERMFSCKPGHLLHVALNVSYDHHPWWRRKPRNDSWTTTKIVIRSTHEPTSCGGA